MKEPEAILGPLETQKLKNQVCPKHGYTEGSVYIEEKKCCPKCFVDKCNEQV